MFWDFIISTHVELSYHNIKFVPQKTRSSQSWSYIDVRKWLTRRIKRNFISPLITFFVLVATMFLVYHWRKRTLGFLGVYEKALDYCQVSNGDWIHLRKPKEFDVLASLHLQSTPGLNGGLDWVGSGWGSFGAWVSRDLCLDLGLGPLHMESDDKATRRKCDITCMSYVCHSYQRQHSLENRFGKVGRHSHR